MDMDWQFRIRGNGADKEMPTKNTQTIQWLVQKAEP
jgi:hypothetical protein